MSVLPVLYKVRVGLNWGLVDTQDIVNIADMCFLVEPIYLYIWKRFFKNKRFEGSGHYCTQ